jgi:hypothetical protein
MALCLAARYEDSATLSLWRLWHYALRHAAKTVPRYAMACNKKIMIHTPIMQRPKKCGSFTWKWL